MRPPRNFFVHSFQRGAGMLSRVADNLYWMSRYLERAEHTARLVDVELQLWLDQSPEAGAGRWRRNALPRRGQSLLDEPLPRARRTHRSPRRRGIAALARPSSRSGRGPLAPECSPASRTIFTG